MSVDHDSKNNDSLEEGCPEYDTRCANCDHYPWTDVFVNTWYRISDAAPSWHKNDNPDSITGEFSYSGRQYKCNCMCHNVPINKKLMRFSFKRKEGKSQHVMHVEKLAVCPFCKRSEFEDTVYAHMPRDELLAEDSKATGAPERGYEFDYNDKYLDRKDRNVMLTPCAGNHKHEWKLCKCGRWVCKISFRNYFGYEIDDDLFNNDLVDKSHYSKQTRALLDRDDFEDEYEPKPDEVPVYATMETIEKVWGKMPMYRNNPGFIGWGPSSYFTYKYQDETTRPRPLGVFDISGTPEHLRSIYLIEKRHHEYKLNREFMYEVYGIGDTTADKLLEKFGTADEVFSATTEEIAKISGFTDYRASVIRKKLDKHAKTRGQEYRDKKRGEPFYHRGYSGYGKESFS